MTGLGVTEPFPIQAATLPERAGRPRRPRPRADRLRQDAGLRARAARPDGGPAGGVEAAARAGPGADPGTRPAGERRAGTVRADAERAAGDGGRRAVDQQAAGAAADRRRGGHRDAGAAGRPGVAPGLPPEPGADHGAGRGGPDVRPGLPAAGLGHPGPGPRRRAAAAVLGHARPQRRPAGARATCTTRCSPRSTGWRARSPRWNTMC